MMHAIINQATLLTSAYVRTVLDNL